MTVPAEEGEVRDPASTADSTERREGLEPPTLRFEGCAIARQDDVEQVCIDCSVGNGFGRCDGL